MLTNMHYSFEFADPFFGMTAEQILDDLPAMRMNLGTNALNYAIRCATVGFDRLLAQLSANAAIRSNVSCKRAALEFASLRSVTLAALGQSEGMCRFVFTIFAVIDCTTCLFYHSIQKIFSNEEESKTSNGCKRDTRADCCQMGRAF